MPSMTLIVDSWCRTALALFLLPSTTFGENHTETCAESKCHTYDDSANHENRVNIYKDESGEYFALKYDRKFGVDTPLQRPLEPIPWQTENEFASVVDALDRDGAVVLKEAIEPSVVSALRRNFGKLLEHDAVVKKRNEMQSKNTTGAFYNLEEPVGGVRLRKTTHGRYEYKSVDRRDGGELVHELQIPEFVEPLLLPPVMKRLLSSGMNTPWRLKSAGVLTSLPGAAAQDWHRDIGTGLFGEAIDISLPEYYFNALWPLDIVTQEQGTEVVLRSHKVPTANLDPEKDVERVVAVGNPGDLVFFNGKMIHRGMPNPTNHTRCILYIVFAAKWFEQGRDQSKEYWVSGGPEELKKKKHRIDHD